MRRPNAEEEQINYPPNPKHYWRFRFHVSIEELAKSPLTDAVLSLNKSFKRGTAY